MDINKTYCGDSLEVLKTFPDEIVDCCITSPPYWGLRDYGTATWEGGDDECEHIEKLNLERDVSGGFSGRDKGTRGEQPSASAKIQYKDICGKCGAKRIDSQLGLEKTPEEFVENLVKLFREVKRVLKKEGTLWLNLGDSYCGTGSKGEITDPKYKDGRNGQSVALNNKIQGLKSKDLVGIPWRVAFALQADGWYLRQDIIWAKPNPMPESVRDRCTKSHEYVFLLSKNKKYYYDHVAIKEPVARMWNDKNGGNLRVGGKRKVGENQEHTHGGEYPKCDGKRNKRSVWTVTTKPFREAHFATFPEDLIVPMVKAGCPKGGIVLDPFFGAGTTGLVALKLERQYVGIELNPEYIKIAEDRLRPFESKLF